MLKKIASWFIPSNEKLAQSAASRIRNTVNSSIGGKTEIVAKYATYANECAAIGQTLSDMLKDGTVSEIEADTLAKLIEPLIAKCREVVGV